MSRRCPPRRSGPLSPAIDNHTLPPLPLGDESWRLFSPSTKATFGVSKRPNMPLVPPPSPRYIGNHILVSQNFDRMEEVSRVVPQVLNYYRGVSDDYVPGLTHDDHALSSDSDTSSDEERYHLITDELFNSYLEFAAGSTVTEHQLTSLPEIFDAPEVLSSAAPRLPAGHIYAADDPSTSPQPKQLNDLHRSKAQRNPHRAPAFLHDSPPPILGHTARRRNRHNHNTWPSRTTVTATPLSLYPTTTTTNSQRGAVPYSRPVANLSHTRSTPNFRGCQTPVVEKSVFDDDSDDDGEAKTSFAGRLHHIRNLSGSSKDDSSPVKPKRRSLRRSASEVIKDFFHVGTKK